MIERTKIVINTEKQFTPLDDYIHEFIKGKKGDGIVNIFVAHTTCAIKVLEGELLLLADINNCLHRFFPKDALYMHDKIEIRDVPMNERVNGFAHLRQLFFSSDVTLPVQNGKMMLGQWQTVYLIELDPIRDREVIITYME